MHKDFRYDAETRTVENLKEFLTCLEAMLAECLIMNPIGVATTALEMAGICIEGGKSTVEANEHDYRRDRDSSGRKTARWIFAHGESVRV